MVQMMFAGLFFLLCSQRLSDAAGDTFHGRGAYAYPREQFKAGSSVRKRQHGTQISDPFTHLKRGAAGIQTQNFIRGRRRFSTNGAVVTGTPKRQNAISCDDLAGLLPFIASGTAT